MDGSAPDGKADRLEYIARLPDRNALSDITPCAFFGTKNTIRHGIWADRFQIINRGKEAPNKQIGKATETG